MTKLQKEVFERTYNNCLFYIDETIKGEIEDNIILKLLINEYGCLRGIFYTLSEKDYYKNLHKFDHINTLVEPLLEREKYWESIRRRQLEKTRND